MSNPNPNPNPMRIRVASYNCSLARNRADVLLDDILRLQPQIQATVRLILALNADILLLNEFDYAAKSDAEPHASVAADALLALINQQLPSDKHYCYYTAAVNTGILSPIDFNRDGKITLPTDGFGFGQFAGQYGMLLLSRFPIDVESTRTFQHFLWTALSEPNLPWVGVESSKHHDHSGRTQPYFTEAELKQLRLSSKSHWDVLVQLPNGEDLHCLASHPTPPVFDGAERRNLHRNAAEIRFWCEYIAGRSCIDDQKRSAALYERENSKLEPNFVILGDLNNDPLRGDGDSEAIRALLDHERVQDTEPKAPRFSSGKSYTAKFQQGNFRVDYALPSRHLSVIDSGVYWHAKGTEQDAAMRVDKLPISDHYPVWLDLAL